MWCNAEGMKLTRPLATVFAAAAFAMFNTPQANAEVECHWDGVPVILAIGGASVVLVCGDGNSLTHTTTVTIDPSLEIDPHLLTPAPPPAPPAP